MSVERRPNIVFILTDQQRFDTIRALGFKHMDTPNLDRLVRRGTSFTRMYVSSPSCAPSRASLFTGTYPHTNGVMRNGEPWPWSWVTLLNKAGYRCVNVGKMHTNPVEGAFGFHERHVVENKDRAHPNVAFYLDQWDKALWARGVEKPSRVTYRRREDYGERLGAFIWELDESLHADVFVADLACLWLERYPGKEPFFLQIGLPGPHPPYDPTPEYLAKYADRPLPEPIRDYDLESQPAPLRALRRQHLSDDHDAIVHLAEPSPQQMHRQRTHYYANVSMIDTQVGKVLDALETRGVLDDTIIVFTSDHGDCLNDHGHSQKWTMYEQSVRVPAIVAVPGIENDLRVDDLVSLMDLGPTVLELAGVDVPSWMEAKSLRPYLNGEDASIRESVFSEHANDKILEGTQFMTMVRKGDWKLVHFVDIDEGQLFDLEADPREVTNRWDDPDCAAVKQSLLLDMLNWRIQSDRITQGFRRHLASVGQA
ncbi:sulfatase family protein [Devosia nitrariae]|uniref:Arylsulfatase n=1 Tax=Devosia nitrariae TaxID=2071872 RepID=A0ABQ5VZT2_9HYPH|nr:sulfatase-like hydrolase/transferase [Devosia nitrariae]GLQ53119.1 arylsulfatase [Devosia nitrariae]